jgi:hypothetical protein
VEDLTRQAWKTRVEAGRQGLKLGRRTEARKRETEKVSGVDARRPECKKNSGRLDDKGIERGGD